jgi:ribosomal protein S16
MNLNLADALKKLRVIYTKKETREDGKALTRVKPYVPPQQPDLKKTGRGASRRKGTKASVAEGADMSIAIAAIIRSALTPKVQTQVQTVLHSCIYW